MNQADRLVKIKETSEVIIGLRDDDIIHIYFKPNTEITVRLQEEMLEMILELVEEGKMYPYIFEAGEFLSVQPDARKNALIIEERHPSTMFVMTVSNLAQRILANYYYKIKRPKRPYHIVDKFSNGIEWLHEKMR